MAEAAMSTMSSLPTAFSIPKKEGSALIGTGDIVIPGVVLNFFLNCDNRYNSNLFTTSFLSYIFGVCLTLIMVHVMGKGQPALLWIFPSVLIITLIKAHFDGVLGMIWKNGANPLKQKQDENEEVQK
ncbi:signal peptide peptidase family protein [Histomonas meleagridis]|uniref:signal peptide peptidase family protein n=1 Tax=Histomonas meleagridis TaxID=135588 RepID=UPI00355AA2CE|nr:signal peptide peptidase family protein [Histomonas meleagridis]KAH0803700.1 signal peptide peptidase family protein [Histomonas meleagridis]